MDGKDFLHVLFCFLIIFLQPVASSQIKMLAFVGWCKIKDFCILLNGKIVFTS